MSASALMPESPNIFKILAEKFPENTILRFVYLWENVSYSLVKRQQR